MGCIHKSCWIDATANSPGPFESRFVIGWQLTGDCSDALRVLWLTDNLLDLG